MLSFILTLIFAFAGGLLLGWFGHQRLKHRDRSMQAQRELDAKRLNQRFQLALEGSSSGIWEYDMKTNATVWSDRTFELIGYLPYEIKPSFREWQSRIHRDDKDKVMKSLEDHLKSNSPYEAEFRLKTKQGHFRWFKISGKALRNDKQEAILMAGSLDDINEKKMSEIALAKTLRQLEQAKEATRDAYWYWRDLSKDDFTWDDTFYSLVGYQADELNQGLASFLSLLSPQQQDLLKEEFDRARNGQKFIDIECQIQKKNRHYHWFRLKGRVYLDSAGSLVEMAGSISDINDLKVVQEDLEHFVYMASHDLKAPVRHIRSYIEVLKEETVDLALNESARDAIDVVTKSADKMKSLIDGILKYAKIGREKEELYDIDLNVVVEDILDTLDSEIQTTKARINFDNLPQIKGRETLIYELFQNLIGNALAYRSSQDPIIGISWESTPQHWKFMVDDNGIGVAPECRESIFDIFRVLHDKTAYGNSSGIGLSICKKVVESHRGKIAVEDSPLQGSRFVFTIDKNPQG